MDRDRIEGKAKQVGGKIKDAAGRIIGDNETRIDGKVDQLEGKVQEGYGRVKDEIRAAQQERDERRADRH